MVAQGIDCHATNLRVFTGSIVIGYHPLNFVPERLIERSLAGNRSTSRGFSSTSGFKNFAPAL
jgi:hypothetical protein